MTKRRRPSILIDEHVHPTVKDAFVEAGLRTVNVSGTRYAGRDERDYQAEMYAANEILVTGDKEFVDEVLANRPRHAGVIYVPQRWSTSEKRLLAEISAGFVRGATTSSEFLMRGRVLYPAHDGLHMTDSAGNDALEISWDRFSQLLDDST